jgi:hypothetical protein
MANHLLVIASLLVIACAMVTAFEPSPLQDFCVADPTSSGQDLTNLLSSFNCINNDACFSFCSFQTINQYMSDVWLLFLTNIFFIWQQKLMV